jgi:hypothetical protein
MSDHEPRALDALRRLDGPAELDEGVEARIEAEMLARFDDRVGSGGTTVDAPPAAVALEDARDRPGRRRANPVAVALAVAAAAILVVAGIVLVSTRDEPAPAGPPNTRPPSATTFPAVEQAALDDQLEAFCTSYIAPLRAADDLWIPDGMPSEARANVLVASEQAAQAMRELDTPLAERLALPAEQALEAVTDARLAHTLDEPDADDAVLAALEAVLVAPSASGASQLPATCSP